MSDGNTTQAGERHQKLVKDVPNIVADTSTPALEKAAEALTTRLGAIGRSQRTVGLVPHHPIRGCQETSRPPGRVALPAPD